MKDFSQKILSVRATVKKLSFFVLAAFFVLMISVSINAQIIAFETNGLAGNEATINSTTTAANLNVSTLSRGAGANPTALANSFNSTSFDSADIAGAIAANDYLQFTVSPQSGFRVSLSTLNANFRRTSTGPTIFQYQYSLDGFATAGVNIGSQITFTDTNTNGVAQPTIDLSMIAALQNVSSPTVITFRLYAAGGTGGNFAIGRLAGNDLAIGGTVSAIPAALPDLTISQSAPSSVVTGSTFTYTLTVTNTGTVDVTGVAVRFTFPANVTFSSATPASSCAGVSGNETFVEFGGCSFAANSVSTFLITVTATAAAGETITSLGMNVVSTSSVAESNEGNNTAADVTTTVTAAPTAAGVNLSGRVATETGRGIWRASIMLSGGSLENPVYAVTDFDGNYKFYDIPAGETYVLSVVVKGYKFNQTSILVNLNEDYDKANFIGIPKQKTGTIR